MKIKYKRKKRHDYILIIIVLLLLTTISIGYSLWNSTLTIHGIVTLSGKPTDLIFTKEFFEQGSTFLINNATINITADNVGGSAGLSITGRPVTGWDTRLRQNMIRWYKDIDLTNYSKLTFYAKNGALHGCMGIYIDDIQLKFYSWGDYGWHGHTEWMYFEIDIRQYTGIHMLTFMGGHTDHSGNPASNTQYCDIKLVL